MYEFDLDRVKNALPGGPIGLNPGASLDIPPPPKPFVPPPLTSEIGDPFSAEILLFSASAAVGKSTTAAALAASIGFPRLDLAAVPVGAGSLAGMITTNIALARPLDRFHQGLVPIIVDAPDEGRLRSGDPGLGAFLETSFDLLSSDRTVSDHPKLIFFGRDETVEQQIAERLAAKYPALSVSRIRIAFFNESLARELVWAYALMRAATSPAATATLRRHPRPFQNAVTSYFRAIEQALQIRTGELWSSLEGRAFAGYAPVLAGLGTLLAHEANFQSLANELGRTGTGQAWDVIEKVADWVLNRERDNFRDKLAAKIGAGVPGETYVLRNS